MNDVTTAIIFVIINTDSRPDDDESLIICTEMKKRGKKLDGKCRRKTKGRQEIKAGNGRGDENKQGGRE